MKRPRHDSATPHPMALPHPDLAWPWSAAPRRIMLSAILTALVWTTVGLFQAVPEVFRGFEWPLFVSHMIDAWTWALLTPVVLLIDRQLKSSHQNATKLTLIYLSLSIPFTLVHTYLTGLFLYPIPNISWNPLREAQF